MSKLEIQKICVKIGEKQIVSDCCRSFESGNFYVIFGKSGSGKSTLLKAVANLQPFSGDILFNNQSMDTASPGQYRRQVHYLHQEPVLIPGTVQDNLQMPFQLAVNRSLMFDESKAVELLTFVGLDKSFLNQKSDKLSGGEKQRVCLVRAMMMQPDFLLLDEPSSALDMGAEGQIIDLLKQISECIGVIVVSHSARVIASADMPLLMQDGKLSDVKSGMTMDEIYQMVEDERSNS